MICILLVITFAGLILASRRRMGIGNPFQIYFIIWFMCIFGYYVSRETYIIVSSEFFVWLIFAKTISFVLLLFVYTQHQETTSLSKSLNINETTYRLINLAQIAVMIALPFVYLTAVKLTGGHDVFTGMGYRVLRLEKAVDGYGYLRYFLNLSLVVSSLKMFFYFQGRTHYGGLVLSILVSLSYIYLATGRTIFLLFMCLMITPLVLVGAMRLRGVLISFLLIASFFMFIAGMTSKGISVDESLSKNIDSFTESMRSYTIAPFVAFSNLVASEPACDWGENTFRFFYALRHAFGVSDKEPIQLIRDYAFVPCKANVYTVYDPYFRDFSYFGIFIPPFFLIIHYWLYRKATCFGGIWLFYYSATIYPLLMQFFQDQYFSLLSTWLQFAFWYWLFLVLPKSRPSISEFRYARRCVG